MKPMEKFVNTPLEKMMNKKLTTVSGDTSVTDAARLMKENHIGAVLIMKEKSLVGIFTERDIVYRVICDRKNADETPVSKVMTKSVVTMKPDATIEAAILLAGTKNIRHVPVVNKENKVVGIIGLKDIMAEILEFTLPL